MLRDQAYGLDRALPPNRVRSFNGYIDLSTQLVVQLEGSVGAPCGTGVGDCGIICAELDAAGCQAGGARDVCSPVPAIGAFVRCDSKRGAITHPQALDVGRRAGY